MPASPRHKKKRNLSINHANFFVIVVILLILVLLCSYLSEKVKELDILLDKLDVFFVEFNTIVVEVKSSYADIRKSFKKINEDMIKMNTKVEVTIEKYNNDRKIINKLCHNATFISMYETMSLCE